jgi:transcriptional regulator with GAF, ATPase, and Fis domain
MQPAIVALSGALKGVRLTLADSGISIGRHPSNDLCLNDPSVSRHHCVIRLEGGRYVLLDGESINGTCLNGSSIDRCELKSGDQIGVGDNLFRFFTSEEEESGAFAAPSLESNGWLAQPTVRLDRDEVARSHPQLFVPAQTGTLRTRRELEILLRIGELLECVQDVECLQLRLFELIAEGVPAMGGAIVRMTRSWNSGRTVFGWERDKGARPSPQLSSVILDQVLHDGAAVLSNDISAAGSHSILARRITSVLAVPLLVRDEVRGALYLDTPDPERVFDEGHLKLATAVSGFAALALDNAERTEALRSENRRLRDESLSGHQIVGESAPVGDLLRKIQRVAPTDATTLILGETGTGKELAARAIHQSSGRRDRPFEAINCSLLQETLLESELFGHEKGAFTGAVGQKRGKLEIADGGTVFLDEIGELSAIPQAMLLRVLQDRTFQRLGGTQTIRVNVRLIAATNRNLEDAVREKSFREDLFYRLNVVRICVPPLRERADDIPLLAEHFASIAALRNKRVIRGISPEALAILMRHDWPGNVRELENTMEYAVIFGSTEIIVAEDLPEALLAAASHEGGRLGRYHDALRLAKQDIVRQALKQTNGSYPEAAATLGIHVNNLYRLIRELDLKPRTAERSGTKDSGVHS